MRGLVAVSLVVGCVAFDLGSATPDALLPSPLESLTPDELHEWHDAGLWRVSAVVFFLEGSCTASDDTTPSGQCASLMSEFLGAAQVLAEEFKPTELRFFVANVTLYPALRDGARGGTLPLFEFFENGKRVETPFYAAKRDAETYIRILRRLLRPIVQDLASDDPVELDRFLSPTNPLRAAPHETVSFVLVLPPSGSVMAVQHLADGARKFRGKRLFAAIRAGNALAQRVERPGLVDEVPVLLRFEHGSREPPAVILAGLESLDEPEVVERCLFESWIPLVRALTPATFAETVMENGLSRRTLVVAVRRRHDSNSTDPAFPSESLSRLLAHALHVHNRPGFNSSTYVNVGVIDADEFSAYVQLYVDVPSAEGSAVVFLLDEARARFWPQDRHDVLTSSEALAAFLDRVDHGDVVSYAADAFWGAGRRARRALIRNPVRAVAVDSPGWLRIVLSVVLAVGVARWWRVGGI